ncbi:MAG TPA: hypothetical protein VKP30_26225 [Polyangiaceae bacterium]|nr:hypothetical protein [Polyangiaceae bacterium]
MPSCRLTEPRSALTDWRTPRTVCPSELLLQRGERTFFAHFEAHARRVCLHVGVALSLAALPWTAAASEAHPAPVILCSDEPEATRDALASELERYLTFANLDVRATCPDVSEGGAFLARFTTIRAGTIRLDVEKWAAPTRTRVLPWVKGPSPIAETLRHSRVPALALVLEAMLLEFEEPNLLHTPVLAGDPVPEVSTRKVSHVEKSKPDRRSASGPLRVVSKSTISGPRGTVQPMPLRLHPRTARLGWHVGAGASFLPGSVVAPLLVLGPNYQTDSWGAVFDFRTSLDSNFAVDGRAFETRVYALALGPRYALLAREPFWLGVELLALGSLSGYRRTDVGSTPTHHWFDFGLLVGATARVRLFGGVWGSVRGGVQMIPTAPEAKIANGPVRSTGRVRLPVLLGIDSLF